MEDVFNELFSVIIVHFQQPDFWKDAIKSVLQQDYPSIQLIFADDGTPNFCVNAIEQYINLHKRENIVDVQVLTSDSNQGTVKNLNRAHRACTGTYRMNLAADDALFDSAVLSRFAKALKEKPNQAVGVYGLSLYCDATLKPLNKTFATRTECLQANEMDSWQQYEKLCQRCFILMGGAAFYSKDFMSISPYDENYCLIEDWPFLLKLTRGGHTMQFADFTALKYRAGGVSQQGAPATLSPASVQCFYDHIRLFETEILPFTHKMSLRHAGRIWRRYDGDRYYLDRVLRHYPSKGLLSVARYDHRVLPERMAYYFYCHPKQTLLLFTLLVMLLWLIIRFF